MKAHHFAVTDGMAPARPDLPLLRDLSQDNQVAKLAWRPLVQGGPLRPGDDGRRDAAIPGG